MEWTKNCRISRSQPTSEAAWRETSKTCPWDKRPTPAKTFAVKREKVVSKVVVLKIKSRKHRSDSKLNGSEMPADEYHPELQVSPSLPQFREIEGTNTESCEQGFRRLNMYFQLTRKMTQFKRNVLFWFVNECFNTELECELKSKNLM